MAGMLEDMHVRGQLVYSAVCFSHVDFMDWIQVISLGGRCIHFLNYLYVSIFYISIYLLIGTVYIRMAKVCVCVCYNLVITLKSRSVIIWLSHEDRYLMGKVSLYTHTALMLEFILFFLLPCKYIKIVSFLRRNSPKNWIC